MISPSIDHVINCYTILMTKKFINYIFGLKQSHVTKKAL